MASDILGLFTTPQQYEQQRLAAMEAQALQSARLSPMEQGQYGIALGAQQLGRAIGGALGGEDPQLKIISQRQALAGQLDPSNPDSYIKVAQIAAQSGDQKFAIAVADAGRQAAVQVAQANKERQLAVPADIQKAQMIPQIQDALDQYKLLPPSPERDRAIRVLENQLKVLIGDKATNIAAPLQVANRIAEITRLQATLDPESQDYKILQAEKEQLQRTEKPAAIATPLQVAQRLRQISIAQRSLVKDSPEYQDLEIEKLQLQKAEKQEATPKEIQIAIRIREINAAQRNLSKDSPEYQDLELEKAQLQKTEKPEPRISVGSDAERISLELFNVNYGDLNQTQRAAVNKRIETEAVAKAPKITVDLKDPTAVAKANLDVMSKWEGFLKAGGDVETASRFKALQSSVALAQGGNPTADGATIFNIGKIYDPSGAVQEGDKNTILGNPSIPRKIQLLAQRVFDGGSLTPEQRNELLKVGTELVKGKQDQLNIYRKQYIKKMKDLGGTEEDILDPYQGLIKPTGASVVSQIPTGKSSDQPLTTQQKGKVVKKWSDLK